MQTQDNPNGLYAITIHDIDYIPAYSTVDMSEYPYAAPYAHYELFTPWGAFDLDPNIMMDLFQHHRVTVNGVSCIQLIWKLHINIVTGTATFILKANRALQSIEDQKTAFQDPEFFRHEIQLAMDMPMAQATIDYIGYATARANTITANTDKSMAIVGSIGQAITSGLGAAQSGSWATAIAGAVGSGLQIGANMTSSYTHSDMSESLNAFQASAKINSPIVQSTGDKPAAFTTLIDTLYIQQTRHKTASQSNATYGKPYQKYVSDLTDFGGYVQMDSVQFTAPCTSSEHSAIVKQLQGGIFIE